MRQTSAFIKRSRIPHYSKADTYKIENRVETNVFSPAELHFVLKKGTRRISSPLCYNMACRTSSSVQVTLDVRKSTRLVRNEPALVVWLLRLHLQGSHSASCCRYRYAAVSYAITANVGVCLLIVSKPGLRTVFFFG